MATVGQTITAPEAGWRRYDDGDSRIRYTGTWERRAGSTYWAGVESTTPFAGNTASFKFFGTKLRIINQLHPSLASSILIKIDGISYTFSEYIATGNPIQVIVFEILDLEQKNHLVEIVASDIPNKLTQIDAIDIDSTGYLLHPTLTQKTTVNSMAIGDCIPCRYTATTANVAGYFSELGTCIADEIPITGTSTPNGLFYFIKNEKGMLVADRVIQTGISWDVLNSARCIQGKLVGAVTIPVGVNPNSIWGDETHVYVANGSSSNVTRITRADNTTTTIAVGSVPYGIWGDDTHVYVANRSNNNVTRILRSDNTTTTIAVGSLPEGIWGDDAHVYVTSSGTNNVTRILRSDNTTILIAVGKTTNGIWGDETYVYVTNGTSSTVTRILRADNTGYSVSVGGDPYNIWGDTTHVYVANRGNNNVTRILRSNNTTTTIAVGIRPMGIWGDETHVYVANGDDGSITRILRSNNTTATIAVGSSPNGIWGDDTHVYVANGSSSNVTPILRSIDTMIRSLTGGNAYLGTDGKASFVDKGLGAWPTNNEWDKYIVNSDLGGKIVPGDDSVWHWKSLYTQCADTIQNGAYVDIKGHTSSGNSSQRVSRGNIVSPSWDNFNWLASNLVPPDRNYQAGFRPVLEYPEDPRCTNIWY